MIENKTRQYNLMEIILWIILAGEILALFYYNLFHMKEMVDNDFAKLLRHTLEMAKNHNLFLKDWDYLTTGEIDCSSLGAILIFFITGNIFLSYGISNCINILIYSIVIYKLLDLCNVKKTYRLISLCLIFITYDFGVLSYANMLFIGGGQYAYKVLIPLLLVTVVFSSINNKKGLYYKLCFGVYFFLLFTSTISSGIYVLVCGIVPIYLVWILFGVYDNSLVQKKYLIYNLIGTCFAIIAGLIICKLFEINPNSEGMLLREFDNIPSAFLDTFNTLLNLFQNNNCVYKKVFSFDGIVSVITFGITAFIVFHGISAIIKAFRYIAKKNDSMCGGIAENEKVKLLECMLGAIMVWNFMVLLLTIDTPRYHLIGAVPLIICSVIDFQDRTENVYWPKLGKIFMWLMTGFIAVLSLLNTFYISKYYFKGISKNSVMWSYHGLCEIKQSMSDMYINTCFIVGNTQLAECMRICDPGRIYETYDLDSGKIINYDFYIWERDRSAFDDKNIILYMGDSLSEFPSYIAENYGYVGGLAGYGVYFCDSNPIDGYVGIIEGRKTIDLPSSPGYGSNGVINKKGYLDTDAEGIVLCSPEIEINKGNRITINYSCDNSAILILFRDGEIIEEINLLSDKESISYEAEKDGLYQFIIDNDESRLQIREMEFDAQKQ